MEHGDAAAPDVIRKAPGLTKCDAITLERGVSHDREFERWAKQTLRSGSVPGFGKDVLIELLGPAGKIVAVYKAFRCWESEFRALPDLDSEGNAVAIESIKLKNEGWQREPPLP